MDTILEIIQEDREGQVNPIGAAAAKSAYSVVVHDSTLGGTGVEGDPLKVLSAPSGVSISRTSHAMSSLGPGVADTVVFHSTGSTLPLIPLGVTVIGVECKKSGGDGYILGQILSGTDGSGVVTGDVTVQAWNIGDAEATTISIDVVYADGSGGGGGGGGGLSAVSHDASLKGSGTSSSVLGLNFFSDSDTGVDPGYSYYGLKLYNGNYKAKMSPEMFIVSGSGGAFSYLTPTSMLMQSSAPQIRFVASTASPQPLYLKNSSLFTPSLTDATQEYVLTDHCLDPNSFTVNSSGKIAVTGGGSGGLSVVSHDSTLTGDGTGTSELKVANPFDPSDYTVKSLVAGSNITLSNSSGAWTINSSGGGGGSPFPMTKTGTGSSSSDEVSINVSTYTQGVGSDTPWGDMTIRSARSSTTKGEIKIGVFQVAGDDGLYLNNWGSNIKLTYDDSYSSVENSYPTTYISADSVSITKKGTGTGSAATGFVQMYMTLDVNTPSNKSPRGGLRVETNSNEASIGNNFLFNVDSYYGNALVRMNNDSISIYWNKIMCESTSDISKNWCIEDGMFCSGAISSGNSVSKVALSKNAVYSFYTRASGDHKYKNYAIVDRDLNRNYFDIKNNKIETKNVEHYFRNFYEDLVYQNFSDLSNIDRTRGFWSINFETTPSGSSIVDPLKSGSTIVLEARDPFYSSPYSVFDLVRIDSVCGTDTVRLVSHTDSSKYIDFVLRRDGGAGSDRFWACDTDSMSFNFGNDHTITVNVIKTSQDSSYPDRFSRIEFVSDYYDQGLYINQITPSTTASRGCWQADGSSTLNNSYLFTRPYGIAERSVDTVLAKNISTDLSAELQALGFYLIAIGNERILKGKMPTDTIDNDPISIGHIVAVLLTAKCRFSMENSSQGTYEEIVVDSSCTKHYKIQVDMTGGSGMSSIRLLLKGIESTTPPAGSYININFRWDAGCLYFG